jgi:zinc protease
MIRWAALFVFVLAGSAHAEISPWVERTTAKGFVIWVAPQMAMEQIALRAAWRGGSDSDPLVPAQLSMSAAAMVMEGAGALDAVSFAGAAEDLGAEIGLAADREFISGGFTVPRAQVDQAAKLFRSALMEPRLAQADAERLRQGLKADLPDLWKQPGLMAYVALARLMLPDHPHLKSLLLPNADPPKISTTEFRAWMKAHLARDNLLITIAGAISPDDAAILVDQIFADLPAKARIAAPPPRTYKGEGKTVVVPREGDQTLIAISQPVPGGTRDDAVAADLLSDVLGDETGRLFKAVRERRGLSYGVEAVIQPSDQGATLLVTTSVPNDKAREVLDLIRQELTTLAEQGVDSTELNAQRARRRAAHGRQLTSADAIASEMIFYRLRREPVAAFASQPDRDDAVSLDVVNQVARRYFSGSRSTTVLVGTPSELDHIPRQSVP